MGYKEGKNVAGWPGYRVEEDGKVWSSKTSTGFPKELKHTADGYVTFTRPGQTKQMKVSDLVEHLYPSEDC